MLAWRRPNRCARGIRGIPLLPACAAASVVVDQRERAQGGCFGAVQHHGGDPVATARQGGVGPVADDPVGPRPDAGRPGLPGAVLGGAPRLTVTAIEDGALVLSR